MFQVMIFREDEDVWFLDATFGVIVSVVFFVYGARTLFLHGHVWWKTVLWTSDVDVDVVEKVY
jgi:hypothetical protein